MQYQPLILQLELGESSAVVRGAITTLQRYNHRLLQQLLNS
jgi:hypothetical protein